MENTTAIQDEVMEFFKALANPERLKLTGLLALEPMSIPQLGTALHLEPAEVYRHLSYMTHLGIVKASNPSPAQGQPDAATRYTLDVDSIQALSRRVLAGSRPAPRMEDFEGEDYDRKVLKDWLTADGKLKGIPSQHKKLLVILRHLANGFEPGTQYPEKQVNDILRKSYPDTATLRRNLVDEGMLKRENGIYWRTP